jgi:hypothetical protein
MKMDTMPASHLHWVARTATDEGKNMKLKLAAYTVDVFPLERLYSRLSAYYIDATGAVYSTKGKNPVKLLGSCKRGGQRYYTLDKQSWSGTWLLNRARNHPAYFGETSSAKAAEEPVSTDSSGSPWPIPHAPSVEAGLKAKGWVIGQVSVHEGEQFLMFGSKPKIHLTVASVDAELARLAGEKPGTKFVSFKVDKAVVAGGLSWE